MTIRSTIASGRDARTYLGRGIRSMFTLKRDGSPTPPVDTESERRKSPKTDTASQ